MGTQVESFQGQLVRPGSISSQKLFQQNNLPYKTQKTTPHFSRFAKSKKCQGDILLCFTNIRKFGKLNIPFTTNNFSHWQNLFHLLVQREKAFSMFTG